ncbi:MAG: hypothetical protein R2761_16605 [Acidimicrobiales bacterium]
MGTAVQVAVAAGLALAWIWVLGRPLLGGFRPSDAEWAAGVAPDDPDGGGDPDFWEVEPVGRFGWHGWRQRSPVARRRQALLATMFATFASFLLALALRGRFVWLFGLMVFTLAVHLAIASYLGGRMLRAREEARRAGRVRQPAAPAPSSVLASAIGPHHHRLDRSYKSPISSGEHAVSSFVEALIQMEWGTSADEAPSATPVRAPTAAPAAPAGPTEPPIEVDVLPDPPIEVDVLPPEVVPAAPDLEPEPEATPAAGPAVPARATPAETPPATAAPASAQPAPATAAPAAAPEEGPKPAPFTRPAAQSAPRKPKARPIYIHSQLDEEGFEPPRAVNHP